MPPIIGLTTYGYREKHSNSHYYEHHYAIPKDYVDSVARAGGIPLLIPTHKNDWNSLWPVLDGVILTGGTDIAPEFYQGDPQNLNIHADDPERDATEIALIQHAVAAQDIPVLCVCRGMQVLNVALGGTILAHIPENFERDIHRDNKGFWTLHDCEVAPNSPLARIMGVERVKTYSGHHQAVDRVADGLIVAATAPDGIIEALTYPDHPWLVGVQWHPEKSTATDPTQQRLFDELVRVANNLLR